MTAPGSDTPADTPKLTAEEIGRRFLALLAGVESRDQLSLDRIREVMGIPITLKPEAPRAGYASDDLGGGWRYVVNFIPRSASTLNGIGLFFVNEVDDLADMSSVCGLDFDAYHDALTGMGFEAEPHHGEIGQLRSWRYTKFKPSDGTVDMTISLVPQNLVAGRGGRLCVRSIGTLN